MDKTKLIRCERHGTFYNPQKFDACAICRSGDDQRQSEGFHISPFKVAGVLAGVLAIFFGLGKLIRVADDRGTAVAAEFANDARLDPEPYKALLETVEDLVYTERPRQFGHGSAIMAATSRLSEEIRSRGDGGPLRQARAQQYSIEILTFGQRQATNEDVGYVSFDLRTAQSDWEAVRTTVFRPVDWLHASVGPQSVATTSTTPAMSAATVQMLNDLAVGLENTARFGRQQAMRIGELDGDPRSAQMRRVRESWDTFRSSLNTRLSSAVSGLPEGHMWVSNDARRAHDYLEQAANALASLGRYSSVPQRPMRLNTFDNVDRNISEAKRLLAGL